MTRLKTEWISEMEKTAGAWSCELKSRIGLDFMELAACIAELPLDEVKKAALEKKVAVVSITGGLGTISSFAESVCAIVKATGFDAFVTYGTDVEGIYEAIEKSADIIFMADDDRYIALNCKTGKAADNNIATAKGYAEVLRRMAGDDVYGDVAVLGYGIIGQLISKYLKEKGSRVHVYDKNLKLRSSVEENGLIWIDEKRELRNYACIADATCEGKWLTRDDLKADVKMVAPGVPLSLDEASERELGEQCIHDFLEIGTVGMLGLAL